MLHNGLKIEMNYNFRDIALPSRPLHTLFERIAMNKHIRKVTMVLVFLPQFVLWSLLITTCLTNGTAYHEDIETKTHAATAGENELGKEINWPEDFFFGLPCPKFQYPIFIPPTSNNRLYSAIMEKFDKVKRYNPLVWSKPEPWTTPGADNDLRLSSHPNDQTEEKTVLDLITVLPDRSICIAETKLGLRFPTRKEATARVRFILQKLLQFICPSDTGCLINHP